MSERYTDQELTQIIAEELQEILYSWRKFSKKQSRRIKRFTANTLAFHQTFPEGFDISGRELSVRSKSALADYLKSYSWDCFFTATFTHPANTARLAIDRIIQALPTGIVRGFLVGEPHYLGYFHAHGLLAQEQAPENFTYIFTPVDAFRERISKRCKSDKHGYGWAVVEGAESLDCVSAYCSKYVTKGLSDYEFWGDWNKRTEEIDEKRMST